MSHFAHWCAMCPIATVSTLLFYGALLAVLFRKRPRDWVLARLAAPLPSTHAYSGALDAYRGYAAVLVAVGHTISFCYPVFNNAGRSSHIIMNGGHQAVPVFVMLSGLLIFRSLKKLNGVQDLRDYVRRRFLRIYPLYLVTALAGIAVGQAGFKISSILSELFMLRSLNFPLIVNPPSWSLYVEVVFYTFLPLFVVATGQWNKWASAAAFTVLLFADPGSNRELMVWKYFFAGILTSHAADWLAARAMRPSVREAVGLGLFLLGTLFMGLDVFGHDWFIDLKVIPDVGPGYRYSGYTIGLALGFSLTLLGTFSSALISKALGVWPLRVFGTISYSIYLVHPFYLLANFPQMDFHKVGAVQEFFAAYGTAPWWYGPFAFFPGLFLWSAVSYIVIERPFLLMRPIRPLAAAEAKPEAPAVVMAEERKAA